jgi:hypothetical protein
VGVTYAFEFFVEVISGLLDHCENDDHWKNWMNSSWPDVVLWSCLLPAQKLYVEWVVMI